MTASKVRELHDEAMKLAELSMVAYHNGLQDGAKLANEAYRLETQAAELVPDGESSEPTRSILYLSAASLAQQCSEFQAARRLVAEGLAGHPSPRIERELKELYKQVSTRTSRTTFERHQQEAAAEEYEGE